LQASQVFADSLKSSSLKLNWTRGNGSGCVVFAKKDNNGIASPVDGTTYIADPVFGFGTQIGSSGWYCVYNGTGSSVKITGLETAANYVFHVIEFEAGPAYYTQAGQSNPFVLSTSVFVEQTGILLQGIGNHSSVAWGDYDRDGDLDILSAGDGMSRIYRNDGSNTFIEQTSVILQGIWAGSAALGDYDNDGYPDILLTGFSSAGEISRVYRNNGDNTFTLQTGISLQGGGNGSAAWIDYNNDGRPDISLTGNSSLIGPYSKIYRNDGNNTFTEQSGIILQGVYNGTTSWSDFDNDGDPDILITGNSNIGPVSKIYRNNNDNTFTGLTDVNLSGVNEGSAAWGDYDNDSYPDILLTGHGFSRIYHNNRNGTFSEQTTINLQGVQQSSIDWGDYDNDGNLDIVLTGNDNDGYIWSKIYRNNGNSTFSELKDINLTGINRGSVAWGDYNNDTKLDLLLTGEVGGGGRIFKIYRNFTPATNIAPAAPSGLSVSSNETSLTLRWNRVTGDATPSKGMNYNVRIGTSPGGSDVVSPMSLETGSRLLPRFGNAYSDTVYILQNPGKSTYYCSVQAIDNGFVASSFAEEQSLVFSASVQASLVTADSVN
jgi:hypothetical protein